MGKRLTQLLAFTAAALLFMGLLAPVSGQDASGTPDIEGGEIAIHPAHIHSGTCDEIGDVVFPLTDLQAASMIATPGASPSAMTGEMAMASPESDRAVVAQSNTLVEASLDDILAESHVINVHESPENIGNYIACGEITGEPANGELTVDLGELNESGYVGEAVLTDNGDGTTFVHVSLFPSDVEDTATPEGTPAS